MVIAIGTLITVFQNCSLQSAQVQATANYSPQATQQPISEIVVEATEPAQVHFCESYASIDRCKADLRLEIVQGTPFTMIDTSVASLQNQTVKTVQTVFQTTTNWPDYTPNPLGAVFNLTVSNPQNAVNLSELKVECYVDQIATNSNCELNNLRAPLVADFKVHSFSVVISSPEKNFHLTLSIPIARWQQMDKTVPKVNSANNQISVPAGTSVKTTESPILIDIAANATLLMSGSPRNTTIRLQDQAQFLLDSAITYAETTLEVKETSRCYIMGALMNATIKARPGAIIFSDSAVQGLKIELLP